MLLRNRKSRISMHIYSFMIQFMRYGNQRHRKQERIKSIFDMKDERSKKRPLKTRFETSNPTAKQRYRESFLLLIDLQTILL